MSERPWLRRPSVLARQALVLYAALIVYGSWYPFSGWRSLGLAPFAYLFDPMPQYLTAFDVVTNVLGYMPFGALVVLAVYPRWRGPLAVALAFGLGGLLSGVMEAVQTYLRTSTDLRVGSRGSGRMRRWCGWRLPSSRRGSSGVRSTREARLTHIYHAHVKHA